MNVPALRLESHAFTDLNVESVLSLFNDCNHYSNLSFMRLVFDAHADLAWIALAYNRDLTETIAQINSIVPTN